MSGSGRQAVTDVREWSGGPPRCAGVVGIPSWMSGSGREAILDVREWSETLPNFQEWSEDNPECPGVVGRPFRMSRRVYDHSRTSGIAS